MNSSSRWEPPATFPTSRNSPSSHSLRDASFFTLNFDIELGSSTGVVRKFQKSQLLEIEIMTRLSGHSNVVGLKAVYEEEDYVHLVMELCSGGELFHQLEKHGRYSESRAKVLFWHLMWVIFYCYNKGIVHGDLKLENRLLASKATSSPIKLADFGLATYVKAVPEVLYGVYTQAADVWCAGVILYVLLRGMLPFWGKTKSRIFDAVRAADLRFPHEPCGNISELEKELIRKMLCVDPLKRFTAGQALAGVSCSGHLEDRADSSSVSFMVRDQDISFGLGPHVICEPQSRPFTCKSSFTAFLVEPSTPMLLSYGFSFYNNDRSSSVELASRIPSMPRFPYCSLSLGPKEVTRAASFSGSMVSTSATYTGPKLEKPFTSADSFPSSRNDTWNSKEELTNCKRTTRTSLTTMAIHNKRNRTMRLGEFDQLDTVATASVIRWVSCTHLPTASSFRTSLVC
ncbi:hypothetical protein Cgig2_010563 [Carnegiea gigantea]|uniref:Protein kinase domain-containing protein n=1 Tax=Carnegiea gigantea TaxID=171969 RepID=A0A9Q1KQ01_9CARY|nr:hypothetical protein Cgig2_010563 [Carnegiea gigantea]